MPWATGSPPCGLLPAGKSFLEHVFGIGHAAQHSISDRKKKSAILVEGREDRGNFVRLWMVLRRVVTAVFVFHGLFNWMPYGAK